MKQSAIMIAALLVAGVLATSNAFAQRGPNWRGSGGWGQGGQYGRMYNPKTVETITGEVVSADQVTPIKGMSQGIHLTVKTEKETLPVHLGPSWYIENQDIKIEPKDKVQITGSRVEFEGKPAIIAAEVKKGDEVLKLRDENGVPAWAGWRKH
jgi:hypothetical protein